jgi:hypothetical protein
MKLLTIALSAFALCGAALAAPIDTVTAHFSTPVMVGEKTLPAGDVTFNVIHGTSSLLLTVRSASGPVALVVVNRIHESQEPGRASVIIGRSGDALKLERVWLDNGVGFAVMGAQ